jgi:hypothetical protein
MISKERVGNCCIETTGTFLIFSQDMLLHACTSEHGRQQELLIQGIFYGRLCRRLTGIFWWHLQFWTHQEQKSMLFSPCYISTMEKVLDVCSLSWRKGNTSVTTTQVWENFNAKYKLDIEVTFNICNKHHYFVRNAHLRLQDIQLKCHFVTEEFKIIMSLLLMSCKSISWQLFLQRMLVAWEFLWIILFLITVILIMLETHWASQ